MANPPTIQAKIPPITNEVGLGTAMRNILPQQRAFVLAYVLIGGASGSQAARMAGYGITPASTRVAAYRLTHDEKILAAIREETDKKMKGAVLLGGSVLEEIARDPLHKDRFKAALALMDRGGMALVNETKLTVEVVGREAKIEKVKELAREFGMDPRKLLGQAGVDYEDAEFEVVADGSEGLEDLL